MAIKIAQEGIGGSEVRRSNLGAYIYFKGAGKRP